MDFTEIKKIAISLYKPAFSIEGVFPHSVRKRLEKMLRIFFIISFVVASIFVGVRRFLEIESIHSLSLHLNYLSGILFVFWSILFMLEAFYYSYYYMDRPSELDPFLDFDLGLTISKISHKDIVAGFFHTHQGHVLLLRCGVDRKVFKDFLSKRRVILDADNFKYSIKNNTITLKDFAVSLFEGDRSLRDFLFSYGIQKEEIVGICDWITENNFTFRDNERWWSKEGLSTIPSLGRDWSYGQIYSLKQYERPLFSGKKYKLRTSYGANEQKEIEAILMKARGANVILVGNDEAGKMHIIEDLSEKISEGIVLSELKHKRMVVLDKDLLIARNGTKAKFEFEFIKIMTEAMDAGNVILVIEDFPGFLIGGSSIGVDLPSLIEPYLISKSLQVIALADTDRFHSILERNVLLSQHFENILIKEIDNLNTIKIVENELMSFESRGLFFTYPAVVEMVNGAERYFPDGIMPDKALDLLAEIAPKLMLTKKHIVEKSDVTSLLEAKTGIPMGEVDGAERQKLINLEEILHKRIIGQDEAVVAISHAVRRARSGINNPNKPLGSFLFLGPTGVGKTETTKALADAFFEEKADILRLDMSEYSGGGAVSKLTGSFETGTVGTLSTMLREHPYGVLLLDEFEKTTKEVMNLFLQILDEGFFSDMSGKKINARNLIIIATTNAGSDMIWESQKNGIDVSKIKDEVIDKIIKDGTFKPELINRFDGVILFHPLKDEHLRKIAELMLEKLHERLADKGVDLVIDENLINFVMSFGTDPKFGARPMNRAIQEKVEEIIAEKIISGEIKRGTQVVLEAGELV